MADFPNSTDLFRVARDEALIKNGKLSRAAVERDGTDANVLLAGGAASADEVISQLAIVEAGLFLDSAVGTKLDRLVFDRYGLVRKPAAAAVGEVVFSTIAPNPAPFTIPASTKLQTAGGVQYITTVAALFLAGATSLTVQVRSVLAGFDQQANANTITSIVGQITGSPTDLTVNNPLATAGADDAEGDPSLRARARQFFATARRGTKAAIEQGALAVPGVRTATAFELLDALGRPARFVQLIISDAFTPQLADLTPTPPAYAAQSQVLAATVFDALIDVRAAGMFVQVTIAEVVLLPIVLHLTFTAGSDPAAVTDQAKAAAVNYVNNLSPGQTFVAADLEQQLKAVPGLSITGNELASPNGNVVPETLQVLRTSLEIVAAPAL